ncbi:hypothetical protein I312_102632 [Cryptococcus bacillisporus CA1280]|uniref:uncharacterized protein n=1 Tax=Cryptococcus bacillisporus CA1280 TaxID=1296109 RepID=UPI003366278A
MYEHNTHVGKLLNIASSSVSRLVEVSHYSILYSYQSLSKINPMTYGQSGAAATSSWLDPPITIRRAGWV